MRQHSVLPLDVFPKFGPRSHFPNSIFDLDFSAGHYPTRALSRVPSRPPQLKEVSISHSLEVPMTESLIETFVPGSVISLELSEDLTYVGDSLPAPRALPWLRLPSIRKLQVGSSRAKMVDNLSFEGHLLRRTKMGLVHHQGGLDWRRQYFW